MTNICQTIYCLANIQQTWAKQFIIWQRFPRHEKVCFYGTVRKLSDKLFATEMFATRATMVRQTIWQTICNGNVCHPRNHGTTNYLANYLRQTCLPPRNHGTTNYLANYWRRNCLPPRNHGMTNCLANYLQRNCLPPAQPRYDKLSGKLFATELSAPRTLTE